MTVRLLDEAIDLRQAKAGTFAGFLGGEERIESARHRFRRHARAGVFDDEDDIVPRCQGRAGSTVMAVEHPVHGLDNEAPARGHRIAGVDRQIEQRALALGEVGRGEPEIAGKAGVDDDVLAQGTTQEFDHAGDHGVGVDRLRPQGLAPRKGEEAGGQRGGTKGARHRDVGRAPLGRIGRQPPLQTLDPAHDDGQQIVEIMRDAAGELPDRLHLL
jgi:hypothetical protein